MKPITTRLTSSRSIGVLPTRSPMPSAARVDARRAGLERRDAVDDREVAIAVAVPVDADVGADVLDDLHREAHHGRRAPRRGVADGVGEADALRAGADRAFDRARAASSGSARVVSSVTYITSRPSFTANVIASSVLSQQPVDASSLRCTGGSATSR